jgi:uncharacterized membrane protein
MVLASVTMILSILAYIRRINYFKSDNYRQLEKPVREIKNENTSVKVVEEIKTEEVPIKSMQRSPRKFKLASHKDLLIIDLLTLFSLSSFFIPLFNTGLIHNILAGFYLLLIPGYVLMVIIFPKWDELGNYVRFGISAGVTLVITSLVGLILNYTIYGIGINSLLFSLTILTIILVIYAHIRRLRI